MNQLVLITWTSSANYIFGEMLLLGIAIQDCFAAGTKQSNLNLILILFNLVSINEKTRLLKVVDMNVGIHKSIANKFGISTSVLS